MRLVILDDYNLASEWAAKYIRNRIIQFKPSADRYFTLGLPTGELHTHTHSNTVIRLFLSLHQCWAGCVLTCLLSFREYSLWLLSEVDWILQKWRYFFQIRENVQHGWIRWWVITKHYRLVKLPWSFEEYVRSWHMGEYPVTLEASHHITPYHQF